MKNPVRVAPRYKFYCAYKVCAFALVAVAGCATTPPPTEQLAAARAMVSQAQPLAVNDAPADLHTAQAKLASAEAAMQRGDYALARRFAEQAEVDARLAWTTAEDVRAQRAAAEVDQGVKALRDEVQRRTQ
jgi:uncharacterized protein DUF4398